jgi:outer membrane immunogenic protein
MKSKLIRSGLLAAAMLAAPFTASAADLPPPSYKAPAYVAPSYHTWSGFYVGLHAGYGFGTADWATLATDPEPSGFIGGGTLGYNLQTGSWVWGLEADLAYSGMKDDVACFGGQRCETELTWFGTARGRIGYAGWSSMMPYITGGAAFGNVNYTRNAAEEKATKVGWTAGAGLEYAMWSSWSVKLEYLYADLGTYSCAICLPGVGSADVDVHAHIVRAGINYRF